MKPYHKVNKANIFKTTARVDGDSTALVLFGAPAAVVAVVGALATMAESTTGATGFFTDLAILLKIDLVLEVRVNEVEVAMVLAVAVLVRVTNNTNKQRKRVIL